MEKKQKEILNLVVIGNVDSGKSTTCGHLLVKLGSVQQREMNSFEKEAEQNKKLKFKYAYVMSTSKEEKKRGITINTSIKAFETPTYKYTIIDAPGHKDFVKNMITGTQQADAAMLIVSADKGEFESGFCKDGQTKAHALLAYTLGVKQMIVCVNKMDTPLVNYSQERFEEVSKEVSTYLQKIGYKQITAVVPISGYEGDNLIEKSGKMDWYKGPSLLEVLDQKIVPPKRPFDKPLRVPINQVYKIEGIGTVVSGKVESGTLLPGMTVIIQPGNVKSKVLSIEAHKQSLEKAGPGEVVGINLRNVSIDQVQKGYVICDASGVAKGVKEFEGQVIIMNHAKGIKQGYSPFLSCHSAQFSCTFDQILYKIDKKTGEKGEENPEFLSNGESAMVRFKTQKEVCVENFKEFPSLGRFVIRDQKTTVAVGVIKKV